MASDGWKNPNLRILLDSTTDLPPEFVARSGLTICSCRVFLPGASEEGYRDKVDIQSDEFFDQRAREDCICSTSGVPPGDWKVGIEKCFKQMPPNGLIRIFLISFCSL